MAHIGRLVNLGIAKEASRGAGAAPAYWMPKTSFGVRSIADKITDEESYNSIQNNVSYYVPLKRSEGSLEANMRANALGLLLLNIFGEVTSSDVSGARKHTFSVTDSNTHPSLALAIDDPVQDYMYKLAMLESLSISVSTGEFATISAEFRAKVGVESSQTPDYTTTPDRYVFYSRHCQVKVADTTAGLTAANAKEVKSLEINFNKQAIDDESIHSVEPVDIFNRQFSVDGTVELKYDTKDYRDYVIDNSVKAMRIEFQNTEEDVGTTHPTLRFDMPKVQFDEWERTDDLDEIIDQSVTFVPFADPRNDAGYFSDVHLINDITSY